MVVDNDLTSYMTYISITVVEHAPSDYHVSVLNIFSTVSCNMQYIVFIFWFIQ